MSSHDELVALHQDLRSDKVTKRKSALKLLGELLQNPDFARFLDHTTKKMDDGEGGDVKATWAGLCGSAMICVSAEIATSRGKKKPADKGVTNILRRLMTAAEEPKRKARNGVVAPLKRRAGKLFTHVLEVLRDGPSEFASDYAQLLRTHLLAEPTYCARAKASTYEGIMRVYKERLEAHFNDIAAAKEGACDAGAGAEDGNRAAHVLLQLSRSLPHDLSPSSTLPDLVAFLGGALRGMVGDEGRVAIALTQTLCALLARGGLDLDVDTTLAELRDDVAPFVDRALGGGGGG